MKATRQFCCLLGGFVLLNAVGCTAPTAEEMADMMRQPPRPEALNRLNAMVGDWETTAKFSVTGMEEEFESTGRNSTAWDLDNWVLVERWEHDMGDDRMKGISQTWWDANAKVYRMGSSNNYGGSMWGTMTYNEETDTWKSKGQSIDGKSGQKSSWQGTMKFSDDNTMEWEWKETAMWGLMTVLEGGGTSKKQ